jgi:hypothetical protein
MTIQLLVASVAKEEEKKTVYSSALESGGVCVKKRQEN